MFRTTICTGAMVFTLFGAASADSGLQRPGGVAGADLGRFELLPQGEGQAVVRLDRVTGEVSACERTGDALTCHLSQDDRRLYDARIAALMAENERLKQQLNAQAAPETKADNPAPAAAPPAAPETAAPEPGGPSSLVDYVVERTSRAASALHHDFMKQLSDLSDGE